MTSWATCRMLNWTRTFSSLCRLSAVHLGGGRQLLLHLVGNEALIDTAERIHESLQDALQRGYNLRKLFQ
jgi:hypothetical protein